MLSLFLIFSINIFLLTFTLNSILGFDLSEYICELYQLTPDSKKRDYFKSLIQRNEIRI